METQSTLKKVLKHAGFCALWSIFQSLQVINFIPKLTTSGWMQIGFNCLSLIIVFYAVSFTLSAFLQYRSMGIYGDKYRYKILYIFNTHLLFCGVIVAVYVGLSMYLDIKLFENIYPDFVIHFYRRFDRAQLAVWPAIGYAFFIAYEKKQAAKEAEKDEYIYMMEEHTKYMEEWVRELHYDLNLKSSLN